MARAHDADARGGNRISIAHLLWLGEFVSAQPHFERAMANYDTSKHRSLAFKYGQEPGVLSQGFASHNLWFLGFPDRALTTMNDALSLASEVDHPATGARLA
jgi:hypothetical protein